MAAEELIQLGELREALEDVTVVDPIDHEVVVLGFGVECEVVVERCQDVLQTLRFGN